MVTDRVATTGLLALLCSVYPQYHIAFILLISLDIFSHWFHMYSTLLAGSSTHKVRSCSRSSSSRCTLSRGSYHTTAKAATAAVAADKRIVVHSFRGTCCALASIS
eukprot:GHUV01019531.1.p2 GENE.GHUV01019531.1~~GHUV01019531.1.p2  ORF type:complete len:106 (+),score=26.14 GHUV01019531.1:898-1215(+)